MSTCYYAEYQLLVKDEEKCVAAIKEQLKQMNMNCKGNSFDELIKHVLHGQDQSKYYQHDDKKCYSNSFESSFMYELVLKEVFYAMSPYLADGSTAYIEPDDYSCELKVKDGICIAVR